MAKKYVQNVHKACVTASVRGADGKKQEYVFYPFLLNKYTGKPEHTGYSTVDEAELKRLREESGVFRAFEQQRLLRVFDELPQEARTAVDVIAEKERRIYDLTVENEKLRKDIEAGGITQADVDKAAEAVRSQMTAALTEKDGLLDEKSKQLAAKTEEYESVVQLLDDATAKIEELEAKLAKVKK